MELSKTCKAYHCSDIINSKLTVFVCHRTFDITAPVSKRGMEYLKTYFFINVEEFDVIRGYRADDSSFSFAKAFLNNTITIGQLSEVMRLGKLGEQIVLKSEKAFANLNFIESRPAEHVVYYARRKQRDEKARAEYRKISGGYDSDEIYLIDIIREGIEDGDARLR